MTNTETAAVDRYINDQLDFVQRVMDRFHCGPEAALAAILAVTQGKRYGFATGAWDWE